MDLKVKPVTEVSRIRGLDSIRIACAMWVVFAHLGFLPLFHDLSKSGIWASLLRGIWGNLFAGPPAVVVFFVISGFCIHYPYRSGISPSLGRYFLRRYIRIGIPAIAGMLIIRFLAPQNEAFNLYATSNTVVWSLLAEAIYYTIYPILSLLNRRCGWNWLILGCTIISLFVIMSDPRAPYIPSYGPYLTWIVGLPAWMWGCKLAESADRDVVLVVSSRRIWSWRLGIWGFSSLASVLRFHSSIGYPWSLTIFAVFCALWLRLEVAYFRKNSPNTLLEWAGKWSYSIYILHLVIPDIWRRIQMPNAGRMAEWGLTMIIVLSVCYLFYLLVELPSHKLAQEISRR